MNVRMNAQEHIQLWNSAAIKLMDVRLTILSRGEALRSYRFPASGFMYATRGGAQVRMDGTEHAVNQFYVLHAGKGACLDIVPTEEGLEYYLILYKAKIPFPGNREILRLLELHDPFRLQYGFVPLHPAFLFEIAETMHEEWRKSGNLVKFHAKTLLYQWVYEVLRQFDHEAIGAARPALSSQVIYYMKEHFREPLTRKSIAHLFHYSIPYLSKQFRRETGYSIIDYLIRLRVGKACDWLSKTDMAISDVAANVGYADVSYFTRIFRKVTGLNPGQFKDRMRNQAGRYDRPTVWLESSIVPCSPLSYIDNDYHIQHKREGEFTMYRSRSPKGVTLLLGLMLLMSACSNASNAGATNSNQAPAGPAQTEAVGGNASIQASAQSENTPNTSETVTYSAVNGDIQVPKNPKRIVAVAGAYVGHLLALGIQPVGAGAEAFDNNYMNGRLNGVVNIGNDVPLERIVDLQPDLIIIWNNPDNVASLSKIAPTVAIEYGTPMREQLLEIGKLTNKEAQAHAWIAEWDQKIADARPKVQEAVGDKTVSIFDSISAKEFYAYGKFGRGGDIIYGEFDLKSPPIIQKEAIDSGNGWAALSMELLPEYAGDYIFISTWTGKEQPEAIFEGPIWERLPAVKNNRVYRNDERGFVYSDPISLEGQLEFVVDSLTRK